jgi:hypothetical protein
VSKRDRLRRAVLLCAHFSRNLAYYRAGHDRLTNASPSFWVTIDGNFLDVAVMEWCKLFGDQKGKHSWAKVVTDPSRFEAELLSHLGISPRELEAYINEMRVYRDKFLAHLDDLPLMEIPFLDRARQRLISITITLSSVRRQPLISWACRPTWRITMATALSKRRRFMIAVVPDTFPGFHAPVAAGRRAIQARGGGRAWAGGYDYAGAWREEAGRRGRGNMRKVHRQPQRASRIV